MNKKGMSLIALSVTVLVMIILSTVAIGSVLGIVNLGRKDAYETTSRIVRDEVEVIYKEVMNKKEEHETFNQAFINLFVPIPFSVSFPLSALSIPAGSLNVIASRYNMTNLELLSLPFYRVDSIETKKILNIENSDLNFLVNFEKNIVFSTDPINFNNKNVFTLEEIDANFKVGSKTIDLSQIAIGDIVIYDPTKGVTDSSLLTYTSPIGSALEGSNVSGNGHSVQTVTALSTHNKYIVIGKENGRLKLMSQNPFFNFRLRGGQGYLYLEEELHKACSIFGHGIGADKTLVTTYNIGNPEIYDEVKTKKIRGSGARSITLDDLQMMTTTKLITTGDVSNPTINVHLPTLRGTTAIGTSGTSNQKKEFNKTQKQTTKASFSLKPEYSAIGVSNIFISSYHLATRVTDTISNSATFMITGVDVNNIDGFEAFTGTSYSYTYSIIGPKSLRPVVYLSPDVKLETTSILNQWQVVQ